jgi:hypothetical protein
MGTNQTAQIMSFRSGCDHIERAVLGIIGSQTNEKENRARKPNYTFEFGPS